MKHFGARVIGNHIPLHCNDRFIVTPKKMVEKKTKKVVPVDEQSSFKRSVKHSEAASYNIAISTASEDGNSVSTACPNIVLQPSAHYAP